MHTTILATFFEISRTVVSMCSAGILLFLVALWAAKTDIARARGLDKIVALSNLCFAAPLAVFGALHLSARELVLPLVPSYMPWRLFWAYFFGFALLAASLSIATKIQVRWSGLLFGITMFQFCGDVGHPGISRQPQRQVCMDIDPPRNVVRRRRLDSCGKRDARARPRARRNQAHHRGPRDPRRSPPYFMALRILCTRERSRSPARKIDACVDSGAPAHWLSDGRNSFRCRGHAFCWTRRRGWRQLISGPGLCCWSVFIYGPILIAALADPSTGVKIEGINYFFDTLLFAGAILALASATPRTD